MRISGSVKNDNDEIFQYHSVHNGLQHLKI